MPLKIYHRPFDHTHENVLFRELAALLQKIWAGRSELAILLGNPQVIDEDGRAISPDAVFLTQKSFVLIDFKNYGGSLQLPRESEFSSGRWRCDEIEVKGGNQVNPFIQAIHHREGFARFLEYNSTRFLTRESRFNFRNLSSVVCFHRKVEVSGEIPGRNQRWFFVADKDSLPGLLDDVLATGIRLTHWDLEKLAAIFSLPSWDPNHAATVAFDEYSTGGAAEIETVQLEVSFTGSQLELLHVVEDFVLKDDYQVLIVQGPTKCGKSFIIPQIRKMLSQGITGIDSECLAPNGRIANVIRRSIPDIWSVYGKIYTDESPALTAGSDVDELEDDPRIRYYLGANRERANTLYIFDEGHLISDAFQESPLFIFGTGRLLNDIISYVDFDNSKRKVILFGDPHQLLRGGKNTNGLNSEYLVEYFGLKVLEFKMEPRDASEANSLLGQTLALATCIEQSTFNRFPLSHSDEVLFTHQNEAESLLRTLLTSRLGSTKFLSYSNAQTKEVNAWIRKAVLGRSEALQAGDLVMIDNTVSIPSASPITLPQRLFNGEFAQIVSVDSHTISQVIRLRGREDPLELKYRKLKIQPMGSSSHVDCYMLDNYWESESHELSRDEFLAIRVDFQSKVKRELATEWLNCIEAQDLIQTKEYQDTLKICDEIGKLSQPSDAELDEVKKAQKKLTALERPLRIGLAERLKRRISKTDPFVNALNLRFGYALTVNRAQGFHWSNVFVNLFRGQNSGITNEDFFRWAYTALSRSESKVFLLNAPDINPLLKLKWTDNRECLAPSTSADLRFRYQQAIFDETWNSRFVMDLSWDEHPPRLGIFLTWIDYQLFRHAIEIVKVDHKSYSEHYLLKSAVGDEAKIIFSYDKNYEFKSFQLSSASTTEFGSSLVEILNALRTGDQMQVNEGENLNYSLQFFVDQFLGELSTNGITELRYSLLRNTLQLTVAQGDASLSLDVFYEDRGFVTVAYPTRSNSATLYDDVKYCIMALIENNQQK